MMSSSPLTTAKLAEIGLYNLLTRIAQGHVDVDPFLLASLREKGFIDLTSVALTDAGADELRSLAAQLGWFRPVERIT